MKKLTALILSMLLGLSAFAFVGCGGGTEGGGGSSANDPQTLVVWVQAVNQPQYFAWAKGEFEKANPGVTIRVEPKQASALGDSLDVTLSGNKAPDMTATWGGMTAGTLVKGEKLVNVNDIVERVVGENLSEAASYNKLDGNGEFYTIPLHGFLSPVIYYNKTWFDQNSMKTPSTYSELVELATSIRSHGKQPLAAGFSTWHLPHFMQAVHARTMTPDNFEKMLGVNKNENPFTLPGFEEGWAFLKDMSKKGIFCDNITGYDSNTAMTEFISGNAVMFTAPSLDLYSLSDATTFELGTCVLPPAPQEFLPEGVTVDMMKDVTLASGVFSDVLAINAKSKKIDLAKKFAEFLLTKEAQEKLLDFQLLPVRTDVDLSNSDPILKPVLDQMDKGVSGFYQSYSIQAVDLKLLDAGQRLISGSVDAKGAAKILQDFYKSEAMDK